MKQETRKGDGWEYLEKLPEGFSSVEHALELQDDYRDKEVAQLKAQLEEATSDVAIYKEWYKMWKERCEAAERLINVSFSQNNFEEWDNWQRLKNQNQ